MSQILCLTQSGLRDGFDPMWLTRGIQLPSCLFSAFQLSMFRWVGIANMVAWRKISAELPITHFTALGEDTISFCRGGAPGHADAAIYRITGDQGLGP